MNDSRIPVPSVSNRPLARLTAALLLGCAAIGQALPAQSPTAGKEVPQAKPAAIGQPTATTKPAVPTAAQLLAKATERADKENKRVLVIEGRLGSEEGKALQAILKRDRKLSRTMLYEYELLASPTKGEVQFRILDSKGKEIAGKPAGEFRHEDRILTKKFNAWLQEHKAEPHHARKVLADALAMAKAQNKNVFVHLGAPW